MKNIISGSIIVQNDPNIIAFLDTSKYLEGAKNFILKITPPNWSSYVNIEYNKEAITLIKPEHLKLDCLPSGIYHICQSVCPNELTEVCICYLNANIELQELNELACEYIEQDKDLEGLYDLRWEIDVAQGIANECPEKAATLFNIIRKKIDKLKCNC